MENKQKNGKRIALIVVLLIVFLLLGLIGGYLLSDKGIIKFNNNTTSGKEKSESKTEENLKEAKETTETKEVTEKNNNQNDNLEDKSDKKEKNETEKNDLKEEKIISKNDSKGVEVLGMQEKFYNLDDVYEDKIELTENEYANTSIDLDNDGLKEEIYMDAEKDEFGWNSKIDLYVDNEHIELDTISGGYVELFVVDLDETDSYLDIILKEWESNGWASFTIYKYDGNSLKEVNSVDAVSTIYYSKNGKILRSYASARYYADSYPVITDKYYEYKTGSEKNIDMSKYSDQIIAFKNVSFTTDLKNKEKVFEDTWMDEEETFEEYLKRLDIIVYTKVKAYIIGIEGEYLKVKLEDGTIGYFIGPWAG